MNERWQAVLYVTANLCSIALLVYHSLTLRIHIRHCDILRASTRKVFADHGDLLLLSGCDDMACEQYKAVMKTPMNMSYGPCKNSCVFVSDGWKHQHCLLSVVDVAEDSMYKRVPNAVFHASYNGHKQVRTFSSAASVQMKITDLAKCCMASSESSLQNLKRVCPNTICHGQKNPTLAHLQFFSTSLEDDTLSFCSKSTSDCHRFAWRATSRS